MEVEYVDNMVKWLYDDKEIIYETKGVEFATDVATAIYIELMFDGIYEYRFVGFSGKDICKYDDNNLLTIYDENAGKHEIQLEDINDVFIFKEKNDDLIQKRLRTLVTGLANAGLEATQVSNDDLRIILDNFLNSGMTTNFGTVIS